MKINNYIRGDSRTITATLLQSDGVTPFDLTGCEAWFTVNASNNPTDDASAVIQKKITNWTTPTNGIVTFQLTNADTQNLIPGIYYYDIQVKDASGDVTSWKQDQFIVIADITRSVV